MNSLTAKNNALVLKILETTQALYQSDIISKEKKNRICSIAKEARLNGNFLEINTIFQGLLMSAGYFTDSVREIIQLTNN